MKSYRVSEEVPLDARGPKLELAPLADAYPPPTPANAPSAFDMATLQSAFTLQPGSFALTEVRPLESVLQVLALQHKCSFPAP
jgi:hypothetical protein